MPNINLIDNQAICTQVTSVNNVTLANIAQIDNITKSCATCSRIDLVRDVESCESACRGEECVSYYTEGTVGSVEIGNHIYSDAGCDECAGVGFYSDNTCGGSQRVCFTVGADCVITRVDRCR